MKNIFEEDELILKFSNKYSFAALKKDGSVVTWGNIYKGADSSSLNKYLQKDVVNILTVEDAFFALKKDRSGLNDQPNSFFLYVSYQIVKVFKIYLHAKNLF